jgi:hypothetical protein
MGRLLALPVNMKPGWKGLTVKNTTAYKDMELITAVKRFIAQVQ